MRNGLTTLVDQDGKNATGGALIAALLLVGISGVMGATILFATSTDLQISGNYRRAVQTFYAAEAGLAEMQHRLSGATTPQFVGDLASPYQANWSAYVLTQPNWETTDDSTFNGLLKNYVPLTGNLTNTVVQPNSVQNQLTYWTKVHHKTEYDAEQAGHRPLTPHYVDSDGSTILHSPSTRGQLIQFGYADAPSTRPEQFTTTQPTIYPPVEVLTSHGLVEKARSILRAEVVHPAGPPIWAPLYVGKEAVFSGSLITIQGMDSCGQLTVGRPPLSLAPSASLIGTASLMGNPSTPQVSPVLLDLTQQIYDLKKGSATIAGDLIGVSAGSVLSPALRYAEPSSGTLTISQVNGYGILLVKGNIQISAPFQWNGLIIASGQITFSDGLGPSVVNGAMYAEQVHVLQDDVTIRLNTCPIMRTLHTLPVRILNWRQLL